MSRFAPTSTPRVGSSAIRTPGLDQQRAREQELLLVAARQRPAGASRTGVPATRSSASRTWTRSAPAPHEPEPVEPREAGQADVLADRATEDQAVVLARLGDHRDAGADRRARPPRSATSPTRTSPADGGDRTVDRPRELGPPGTDEAGQPDDLAGPDRRARRRGRRAPTGRGPSGRSGRRRAAAAWRIGPADRAARASRATRLASVSSAAGLGPDDPAVAQDRDACRRGRGPRPGSARRG